MCPGSLPGVKSGPGIESRWERDFPHLSRPALGANAASCTMGTGSLPGVKSGPGIESRWGRDFSHLSRSALGAHPASCTMGTGSFPGVKSGRGMTLTPHPLLVSWSGKGRAIPLLPLRAVRLVQSLSACTRVHFTFYFYES